MKTTTFKNLRRVILENEKKIETIKKRRERLIAELQKRCAHAVVVESPEKPITPTRRCLICTLEEDGIVTDTISSQKNKTVWGLWPRTYYFNELDRNPKVCRFNDDWLGTRALQPIKTLEQERRIPKDWDKKLKT
ncbi:MAG: hypothetical protein HYT27_01420 [Parcubacteria group bacterium]|nr:hypothetical protein [Parcubacteria group bacterium]